MERLETLHGTFDQAPQTEDVFGTPTVIVLDRREAPALQEAVRATGIEMAVTELSFGDAMFLGKGPEGECSVGFERKKLDDLITSMKDRRLSGHQLRGCWQAYTFVYLLSEGIFRERSGGGDARGCNNGVEMRGAVSRRGQSGAGGSAAFPHVA